MEGQKKKSDELDLVELLGLIWEKKLFILKIASIVFVVGIVITFTTPKEYEASSTLISEAEGSNSGFLGGIAASLAGINLGGNAAAATISPGLYRSVAKSTPFIMDLMNQEFYYSDEDKKVSVYELYTEYKKSSLIGTIISAPFKLLGYLKEKPSDDHNEKLEKPGLVKMTIDQERVAKALLEDILVTFDWELKVVTIEVEMQDPLIAAEVAEYTRKYITDYVIEYSRAKNKEQLDFITEQYEIRKKEFEAIQLELATFRDKNKYVTTATARTQEEKLQSEYNLAFGLYSQLAQQKEAIILKMNEETAVFSTLQPVVVPNKHSSPQTLIMLILFMFLSVFIPVAMVIGKVLIKGFNSGRTELENE